MSTWTSERARIASLTRSRKADDPDLLDAKRNMRALKLEEYVARVVAEAPRSPWSSATESSACSVQGVRRDDPDQQNAPRRERGASGITGVC